jgi:arylsulfatase A-like enzyme
MGCFGVVVKPVNNEIQSMPTKAKHDEPIWFPQWSDRLAESELDELALVRLVRTISTGDALPDIVIHHSISGQFAIRKGQWKLLLCSGSGGWSPGPKRTPGQKLPMLQLFDLGNDPKETKNLQAKYPDKVKELVGELAKAFRNGRTTIGAPQKNESWPNTIPKPILEKFPQLAAPKK